jgi:hypothetical protein
MQNGRCSPQRGHGTVISLGGIATTEEGEEEEKGDTIASPGSPEGYSLHEHVRREARTMHAAHFGPSINIL